MNPAAHDYIESYFIEITYLLVCEDILKFVTK